jgi:predicted acetyltransferase
LIIELEQVEERSLRIVHNLSQYYSYDISDISDAEYYRCRETGSFEGGCEKYNPAHYDLKLIRVDEEIAGFTIAGPHSSNPLVNTDDSIFTVWEFFVLRRFRNRGVGTTVAHRLFDAHEGLWYVAVWPPNAAAVRFWDRAISTYSGNQYSRSLEDNVEGYDEEMIIFRFQKHPHGNEST